MTIAFVQNVNHSVTTNAVNVSTVAATGAGNLLVILTDAPDGFSISTVVDNKSNTWTQITAAVVSNAVTARLEGWYTYNATGGVTTITVTHGSACNNQTVFYEFSGVLATSDPLDQAGSVDRTNASATANTMTPAVANEVFFTSGVGADANFTGLGGGWTYIEYNSVSYQGTGYFISTDSSVQVPTFTNPHGSQHYTANGFSFKPASSTPAEMPTTMFLSM